MLAVEQSFGNHGNATGCVHIARNVFSSRLQIGQQRSAFADALKIVDLEGQSHLARDGQEV